MTEKLNEIEIGIKSVIKSIKEDRDDKALVKCLMLLKRIEEMNKFQFSSTYAKTMNIKKVTPNGIIYYKNGMRASFKRKEVKSIKEMLPPIEDFNSDIFQKIRNECVRRMQISQELTGKIIYNLYYCNLAEKLEI